ncbi:FtsX-like permease family protein [Buchnera aphidicola (Muscaphis stroyani)]|uniref:FtsX-like permease family protein n=1 Tax=Buchnera aphidicola (Muscaphis stroyani) TaxID=1241869 RepID=A0A4D6YEY7_9GAMM|nr:FtsX-like permease family protein [Buchnera aphidicola]QCI24368.1 FtsX-like permease family protein [Buchnera aphidicola (Muscaphis stroyani)]
MNFLSCFIAKRLHVIKNKHSEISFIYILSNIGMSISVFALIMSFSALNGFQELINEKILSNLPHGIVKLTSKPTFQWSKKIKKLKSLNGIKHVEPYILINGLLENKNKIKIVQIKSFSSIKYLKKYFFNKKKINNFLKSNIFNINSILLSSDLAEYFSIKEGETINLFFLNHTKNFDLFSLENICFKVQSIFDSSGVINSNIGFVYIKNFQKLFHKHDITEIEFQISNPFEANKIILNAVKQINTRALIYTWMNSYKNIYHDINMIKKIVYISVFLIVIISCFSISSFSLMSISKKTREIAILRSIGANNLLIRLIFLYHGLRLIIIGNLIGISTSTVIILNFVKIKDFLVINLNYKIFLDNSYFINFFLLKINYIDVIQTFALTLIIGILTNLYPLYSASNINPIEILKEY